MRDAPASDRRVSHRGPARPWARTASHQAVGEWPCTSWNVTVSVGDPAMNRPELVSTRSGRRGSASTSRRLNRPDALHPPSPSDGDLRARHRTADGRCPTRCRAMWRSRWSSSSCEPLSQASHPQSGNHVHADAQDRRRPARRRHRRRRRAGCGRRSAAAHRRRAGRRGPCARSWGPARARHSTAGVRARRRRAPASTSGDDPCVGPGADDPPLRRVEQPRVLLVERRPVGVRVGPRLRTHARVRANGSVDGGDAARTRPSPSWWPP